MKKYKSEEALLTVREPPPKHLSVVSKKGGHTPAEEDRIKNTYTPDCPPKKKRQPKLKAIIFGESESILNEAILDELNVVRSLRDLWTATKMGLGLSNIVLGDFANFVNIDLNRGKQLVLQLNRALEKPLTRAENYAIKNKWITSDEVSEYRRIRSILEIFGPSIRDVDDTDPVMRPGAFKAYNRLREDSQELRKKYAIAIRKAERKLGIRTGYGRFQVRETGYGYYDEYSGYEDDLSSLSREEMDDEEKGRTGAVSQRKHRENKDRLVLMLEKYISDDGLLNRAKKYLEILIDYIKRSTIVEPTKRASIISDYNQRLKSINDYILDLRQIDTNLDYQELRAEMVRALRPVGSAMTRMRQLKTKVELESPQYKSDTDFPKTELSKITFLPPTTSI